MIESDADFLILLVHVFVSCPPDHDWLLKTRKNWFVNVFKIHDYIGNAAAIRLTAIFFLTGCDTASYLYRKSKKAILERVSKDILNLLYEQQSTSIYNASMKIENI